MYPRDAALLRRVSDLNKHLGQVLLEVMQPTNDDRRRSLALRILASRLRDVGDHLDQRANEIDDSSVIDGTVVISNEELARLATQSSETLQSLSSELLHPSRDLAPGLRTAAETLTELAYLLASRADDATQSGPTTDFRKKLTLS
ncbi:hypothetical protein [Amycolatopsis taiwanensis]|uniref:hypothetical protein n=1 Tax=Amycolatopsis taiwanensis TaxID=342230 RepID=UPI000485EDB1|nr:hypothetical protein [Amycolatopsis taiwanensis]